MIRRLLSLPSLAASLLIPALSGCAYLHKSTPPPVPIMAEAPAVVAPPLAPLYTEMSQNDPALPGLPVPPPPGAQPAPPPASIIVGEKKPVRISRRRKLEIEVAERESREHEGREREAREKEVSATPTPDTNPPPPESQNAKVTAPTPKGDAAAPTSIGQLTAAPSPDSSGSRQQASELIDSTHRGVNSLRNLNGDQNKTVAQIRSFLDQAGRALHNGDVDGAHTLATKAKTLLDELTGAS
ncbi:MAG TPA: hypothetical protein VE109_06685 [Acidobacteriaceae bacterium]|nr:hypothetical protein [Acidobacteriaceae bacterium]